MSLDGCRRFDSAERLGIRVFLFNRFAGGRPKEEPANTSLRGIINLKRPQALDNIDHLYRIAPSGLRHIIPYSGLGIDRSLRLGRCILFLPNLAPKSVVLNLLPLGIRWCGSGREFVSRFHLHHY